MFFFRKRLIMPKKFQQAKVLFFRPNSAMKAKVPIDQLKLLERKRRTELEKIEKKVISTIYSE